MRIALLSVCFLLTNALLANTKQIRLPDAIVGTPYTLNLNRHFKLGGAPTEFDVLMSSPWIEIEENGNLSGTAGGADEGWAYATVTASNDAKQNERIHFKFFVKDVNDPPFWTECPINLGTIHSHAAEHYLITPALDP